MTDRKQAQFRLHIGDCVETMREYPDNYFDSIVTDPPYDLTSNKKGGSGEASVNLESPYGRARITTGFMGQKWDGTGVAFRPETWAAALRVLKPGGHLLAFGGTRTYHRMVCAIEDAGFEVRDFIAWIYGCLDEQTEAVTIDGAKPYHKTKVGDLVLCYDAEHGEYSYQPILEVVSYDYSDTAFRLVSDRGEQVVSRNHRCIVEQGGTEVFRLAETLECETHLPFLEDLSALQQALRDKQPHTSIAEQVLRMQSTDPGKETTQGTQGKNDQVCCVRDGCMEAGCVVKEGQETHVQPAMQRGSSGCRLESSCTQRSGSVEPGSGSVVRSQDDRSVKSGVERGLDVPQAQRCVCRSEDQVRALPGSVPEHGPQRRICDGAPSDRCKGNRPRVDSIGDGSPSQPQRHDEPSNEPDAVPLERRTQSIRAWQGHKATVVRVVPFQYTGKVWCLRVPTGAFVAVRNGVAFPTGNSGFPKSLDAGKALDAAAGVEREVTREATAELRSGDVIGFDQRGSDERERRDEPVTDAAKQWDGWGTALKPAIEPICVGRKPLIGTLAQNLLAHGTGAINIDGCRVGDEERNPDAVGRTASGRWPANLIHSGDECVVAGFPDAPGQIAPIAYGSERRKTAGIYGEMSRGRRPGGFGDVGAAKGSPLPNGPQYFRPRVVVRKSALPGDERTGKALGMYAPGASYIPNGPASYEDQGSAARFFYVAKASMEDREEGLENFPMIRRTDGRSSEHEVPNLRTSERRNHHPTVKPTDLMRYLVRLVTPKVVFECLSCNNRSHDNSTTPANSVTSLPDVQNIVQTTRQHTRGEVLLGDLQGDRADVAESNMRGVQDTISPGQSITPKSMLFENVRGKARQGERERLCGHSQGVSPAVDAGAPTLGSERVHLRTQVRGRIKAQTAFEEVGDRASLERQETGQPTVEPRSDEQEEARPTSETTREQDNRMSALSGADQTFRTCPKCGGRLTSRPGRVLDPFCGSGSTGKACMLEGFRFVGMDMTAEYEPIQRARIAWAIAQRYKLDPFGFNE